MKNLLHIALTVLILRAFASDASAFMFWNQACSFNGGVDSSHISVPHSGSLNITGSFTIEAWINPANSTSPATQIILQKRAGNNNDGYTLLLSSGRVAFRTNSATKTGNTVISNNQWTHIAVTYNSSTNMFSVIVNGTIDLGGLNNPLIAPAPNMDSLFIGKGTGGSFEGQMDEVRLWNRALSVIEINDNRRTTLGASGGVYSGLVMSITFQDKESTGSDFVLTDWSGSNNNGINRGVTAVNLGNRPSTTIMTNGCIELNGSSNDDYVAGPDNSNVSPTTGITLEAWIYLRGTPLANRTIIHKGPSAGGANTNYALRLDNNSIKATINGNSNFLSGSTLSMNEWYHIAFTYNGSTGFFRFFVNGDLTNSGTNAVGNITDGSDSLYIGGTTGLTDFNGFIDEVRISNYVKTGLQINKYLYQSIDKANQPNLSQTEVVYNLDGFSVDNCASGPRLFFRNDCNFEVWVQQLISPLNRSDNLNFQDGYYIKQSTNLIGPSGIIYDTLDLFYDKAITDLNLFVAIAHEDESELEVSLISPDGEEVMVFDNNSLVTGTDNIVTIFDDQADTSLLNDRYVSFGPSIKPSTNLNSTFSGDSSGGKWVLKVNDQSGPESGRLYAWGLQINNEPVKVPTLKLYAMVQGLYYPALLDAGNDTYIRDTVCVCVRPNIFPYPCVGQYNVPIDTNDVDGPDSPPYGIFKFTDLDDSEIEQELIVSVNSRNSIETWSASSIKAFPGPGNGFDMLSYMAIYDMVSDINFAYGSNMIQVRTNPNWYAMFSGDINQDGTVDVTDLARIDNMLNATGYVAEDLNGDEFVDGSDALIVDNNAYNFVTAIIP